MDVDADLILCGDWISSHDLHHLIHLYAARRVSLQSCTALLQLDFLPVSARPLVRTLSVIGHGEFRWLLRQIEQRPRRPRILQHRRPRSLGPLARCQRYGARRDGRDRSTRARGKQNSFESFRIQVNSFVHVLSTKFNEERFITVTSS